VKKRISAGAFSVFVDAQRTLYLFLLPDYLCGIGVPTSALVDSPLAPRKPQIQGSPPI